MTYQFNQKVLDQQGNEYLVVARTDDENTLNVTPVASKYGSMNYCIKHQIAYTHKENCELCRLQVVCEPIG